VAEDRTERSDSVYGFSRIGNISGL